MPNFLDIMAISEATETTIWNRGEVLSSGIKTDGDIVLMEYCVVGCFKKQSRRRKLIWKGDRRTRVPEGGRISMQ
jgi:hypothetical protein